MTKQETLDTKRKCPHCGKRVVRRNNGTLRRHKSKAPSATRAPAQD